MESTSKLVGTMTLLCNQTGRKIWRTATQRSPFSRFMEGKFHPHVRVLVVSFANSSIEFVEQYESSSFGGGREVVHVGNMITYREKVRSRLHGRTPQLVPFQASNQLRSRSLITSSARSTQRLSLASPGRHVLSTPVSETTSSGVMMAERNKAWGR